ncbi:hypothetical protein BC936DRAFT_136830 [Jimgerdemannia flammicorona]|uniref:Uncharacterized protein n=2 Tax=Jimgerdemannia flammicorona TaxID=994334 RepID=A0A433CYQ1_9FUNG|nr:hypothetical protein BC936DRAFT_136830 [Jimgerdemannia flammicorona]RUS35263.1 hypothetical protein BC938DRAFT_473428 [Jimgerdemannia flammicorona]
MSLLTADRNRRAVDACMEEKPVRIIIRAAAAPNLATAPHNIPRPKEIIEERTLSLYLSIFLLILLVSTQVTKSSMFLLTRNAGSVMVSGPTRMWPCSTKVTASRTVSAILSRHMTMGNRRRQKADTVILSASENFLADVTRPIPYSLSRSCVSRCARIGSRGFSKEMRFASFLTCPQSLLYLEGGLCQLYLEMNSPRN